MEANVEITLGGIPFLNFDCPEKINHVGGGIIMAKHKYAGGGRSAQTFGWEPADEITWSGSFFNDEELTAKVGSLDDRIDNLKRMAVAQKPVELVIGRYKYLVMLEKFKPLFELQFLLPYEISLFPLLDLNPSTFTDSTGPTTFFGGGGNTAASTGSVSGSIVGSSGGSSTNSPGTGQPVQPKNPTTGANQGAAAFSPVGGGPQIQNLSSSNQDLNDALKNVGNFPAVPPAVTSQLTNFQQQLTNAIQQALNNGKPVDSATLAAGLNASQNAVGPLSTGLDPGNAAFGTGTANILDNIQSDLTPVPATSTEIDVVNPDLRRLAIYYFGDATKWQFIAAANPTAHINTPNPVGQFKLTIPSLVQ